MDIMALIGTREEREREYAQRYAKQRAEHLAEVDFYTYAISADLNPEQRNQFRFFMHNNNNASHEQKNDFIHNMKANAKPSFLNFFNRKNS